MKVLNYCILVFTSLALCSCQGTWQMNVNVHNQTEEAITVDFTTRVNHEKHPNKGSVTIQPGEFKRGVMISRDLVLEDDCKGEKTDCASVLLDEFSIVNASGKRAKIQLNKKSKFEVVDIQQGEFTIEVKDENF